jgi:hypothetical protein
MCGYGLVTSSARRLHEDALPFVLARYGLDTSSCALAARGCMRRSAHDDEQPDGHSSEAALRRSVTGATFGALLSTLKCRNSEADESYPLHVPHPSYLLMWAAENRDFDDERGREAGRLVLPVE